MTRPLSNKSTTTTTSVSSNWKALKKSPRTTDNGSKHKEPPTKKRKVISQPNAGADEDYPRGSTTSESKSASRGFNIKKTEDIAGGNAQTSGLIKNGESIDDLRAMIHGNLPTQSTKSDLGKYLALDCEMVGVGLDGSESALARVSIVNYHGATVLDEFVRPKERIVDYRTQWSGIRPKDMINAKSFSEVQTLVASHIENRILVGHAIFNDLKALLLSHPWQMLRDTQQLAGKHQLMKTKRPALRKLTEQEFGIEIQSGEHSSVVDARATMAIFRLYRKEWEKDFKSVSNFSHSADSSKKRKATEIEVNEGLEEDSAEMKRGKKQREEFPGGGRRGVSSGLSTVIKHRSGTSPKSAPSGSKSSTGEKWWKTLSTTKSSSGSKGSFRVKTTQ